MCELQTFNFFQAPLFSQYAAIIFDKSWGICEKLELEN